MSTFRRIGDELKEGFSKIPVVSTLMHLDVILIFGSLAFLVVNYILNLGIIGNFVGAFAWYIFIIGLIMSWANANTQFLYAGLYGYAVYQLMMFVHYIFMKYGGFSFGMLVTILIYGGLGFLVMTKVKD